MRNFKTLLATVGWLTLGTQLALANPGISITASPMRFIYTKGAGGAGSIGRIDIASSAGANLMLQQIDFGADNVLGGGNDVTTDLVTLGQGQFSASFTADVFKLATGSYAAVGTYTIWDAGKKTVIEGDFTSQSINMLNGSLSLSGGLFNQNGVLRSGSELYKAPNVTTGNGDGGIAAALAQLSGAPALGNLLQLNLSGKLLTLDKLFGSSLQANTAASIQIASSAPPVVPAPQAAALAVMGLLFVLRRPRID